MRVLMSRAGVLTVALAACLVVPAFAERDHQPVNMEWDALFAASPVYDIAFDGYCDGMHLSLLGDKTVAGNTTGSCIGAWQLTGALGKFNGPLPGGNCILVQVDPSYYPGLQYFLNGNGTWALYILSGDAAVLGNSGTWSFGVPPEAHAAPSSAVRIEE
jgi:hypothetical protein